MYRYLADHLATYLLWTGIALALLASVVVAPDAPGRLLRWIGTTVSRLFRRSATVYATTATAEFKAHGGAVAVTDNWDSNMSLELRVRMLRDQVVALQELVATTKQELREELDRRITKVTTELDVVRRELAALRSEFDTAEQRSNDLDARGLAPIGFGILLSGAPDELSDIPWLGGPWLGLVLELVGVVLIVACIAMLRVDRKEHRARLAAAAAATATS